MNFLKKILFEKMKAIIFISTLLITLYTIPLVKYKVLALFIWIILNFLLNITETCHIIVFSMAIGTLFNLFSTQILLESFSKNIIWQIMCFLFISKALIKSGLAYKISIYIVYFFGKTPLTLSYGLCLLTVLFAVILPTSTARIGGIFVPILSSLFSIFSKDDEPLKETLIKTVVYCNTIASAMFFAASSGNFYIQEITKTIKVNLTAQDWVFYAILPGLTCLALTPIFINYLIKPKNKNFKKINYKISEEMTNLEEFSTEEFIILFIFFAMLTCVFLAPQLNFPLLGIIFLGIFILLFLDLLNFEEDILNNTEAWSVFFWMSHLLLLSALITQNQCFQFINIYSTAILNHIPTNCAFIGILTLYGYSQYFFASTTVHASALYVISFEIATQHGYSPFLSALILAYVSNLFSGLTTYSASEVILLTQKFNCEPKSFNKYGLIISTFIFIIWMIFGIIWWKINGIM